ncbi:MAG: rod shape-determining protein MreC [Minwuia sp.]|nr:rod shape-determining protein MreC [Minwuia sp.]
MRRSNKPLATRMASPLGLLFNRFAFAFLLALGLTLLVAGRSGIGPVEQVRTGLLDILAPVLNVISRPVSAVNDLATEIEQLSRVYDENARLREENARLLHWQNAARSLERDNAQYRRLLNVRARSDVTYITARVVGESGGPFVKTLLLAAGQRDGVEANQAVVSELGLVGRITEAGRNAARILLITDLNSRIPVMLESDRRRAILSGDNSGRPLLAFLEAEAVVRPGDRVVTSGHGGLLPPGLVVGVVSSVADGQVRLRPFVDLGRLERVNVLRYRRPELGSERDGP